MWRKLTRPLKGAVPHIPLQVPVQEYLRLGVSADVGFGKLCFLSSLSNRSSPIKVPWEQSLKIHRLEATPIPTPLLQLSCEEFAPLPIANFIREGGRNVKHGSEGSDWSASHVELMAKLISNGRVDLPDQCLIGVKNWRGDHVFYYASIRASPFSTSLLRRPGDFSMIAHRVPTRRCCKGVGYCGMPRNSLRGGAGAKQVSDKPLG